LNKDLRAAENDKGTALRTVPDGMNYRHNDTPNQEKRVGI
jgi:hypothetical protein